MQLRIPTATLTSLQQVCGEAVCKSVDWVQLGNAEERSGTRGSWRKAVDDTSIVRDRDTGWTKREPGTELKRVETEGEHGD